MLIITPVPGNSSTPFITIGFVSSRETLGTGLWHLMPSLMHMVRYGMRFKSSLKVQLLKHTNAMYIQTTDRYDDFAVNYGTLSASSGSFQRTCKISFKVNVNVNIVIAMNFLLFDIIEIVMLVDV